jgi:hypothetical protein
MMIDIKKLEGDDLGPGSPNRTRVEEIRALAQTLSDDVPFLLAPVRLETRFVQVDEPVGAGPNLAVRLATELTAAAVAAESLAGRGFATTLTGATAKDRREYKATVEQPMVVAATDEIAALGAAVERASALRNGVAGATPEEQAAQWQAVQRLDTALRRTAAAVSATRSEYQRDRLLAALAPVQAAAEVLLAQTGAPPPSPDPRPIPRLDRPTPLLGEGRPEPATTRMTPVRPDLPAREGARWPGGMIALTRKVDQLRVRIFPDDIAMVSHEPQLTAGERAAGIAHWRQAAANGADEPARRAAWRALCAKYGSGRAAWIAHRTRPSVPIAAPPALADALGRMAAVHEYIDRLATGVMLGGPDRLTELLTAAADAFAGGSAVTGVRTRLREAGASAAHKIAGLKVGSGGGWAAVDDALASLLDALENLAEREPDPVPGEAVIADADLRAGAWTLPPRAGALPGRFVVMTVSNGRVSHVVAGARVPADLTLGLDPREENAADETPHFDAKGNLTVGASLRWMVDYDTAAAVGMAITVPITPDEATAGFDRVYVLGISDEVDPVASAQHLADLLDAHHYAPRGLALVPVATPTNNSDTRTSGYARRDDPDRSYDVELGPALAAGGTDPTDGWRLARALGLGATVFDHIAEADGRGIGDALAANEALWPATAGYALEELLGSVLGLEALDRVREFAIRNVVGRGSLPSLRVGAQPYGLLVTTAFGRYVPDGGDTMPTGPVSGLTPEERQRRFDILLRDVLLAMLRDWSEVKLDHAYSDTVDDHQGHVMSVLGLDAVADGYEQRFAVNAGRRGAGIGYRTLQVGLPANAANTVVREGAFAVLQRFAAIFAKARGVPPAPLIHLGQVAPNFADTFDRLETSRGYEVRYLDRAVPLGGRVGDPDLSKVVGTLLTKNLFDAALEASALESDRPLLYLLLRHATLVQARDVALRILAVEGIVNPDQRTRVGAGELFLFSGLGGRKRRVSRWSFLLAELSRLSGVFGRPFPKPPNSLLEYLTSQPNGEARMDDYLAHRGQNALASHFNGTNAAEHQKLITALGRHESAVRRLANLPPAAAERVAVEHLDTCSHRLDAWLLGLPAARLARMRTARPTGVHLGAFGWVENLIPDRGQLAVTALPAELDIDQRSPVYQSQHNAGFIHAPSLNHAATAAILRAGYLAHAPQAGAEDRMAVNVSSRRIRAALDLLDGVSAGNDLGALLGYQFERDLHDAADDPNVDPLDGYIAPLRTMFPSVVGVQEATDSAASGPDADQRYVVDGLRLLTTVRQALAGRGVPATGTLLAQLRVGAGAHPYGLRDDQGRALIPDASRPKALEPILRAIDRLADTVDAVSDLVLTEGMHQLVQGNHPRAAAVLSALGEGRVPARPEVVDTPVVGTLVSHRILLHLPASPGLPKDWTAPSARAAVEPALNHWLGELIGPPGATRASVLDADGAHVADVSLTALRLQPIDLLAILYNGLDNGLTELTVRILDTLRPIDVRDNEPAPGLTLSLDRHPDWPDEVQSLTDTAALVEMAAVMLGRARAATPADYVLADTADAATGGGVDATELATRVGGAVAALEGLGTRLLALLSDGAEDDPALLTGDVGQWVADHADVYRGAPTAAGGATSAGSAGAHLVGLDAIWARRQDLREALLDALGFGITGVQLPTRWVSRDQVATAWLEAAEAALVEVAARLRAAGESGAGSAPSAGVDALLATARAVFTDTTPVLPRFRPANAVELSEALAKPITKEPEAAVSRWLAGAAAVRENVAALTTVTVLAEAFGRPTPDAVPIQLPARAGEAWVGESAPDGLGSRLSLVLLGPGNLAVGGSPVVALRLDAWDELIPAASLTTGVAFNYDQPDSAPPQCLLLAVPPRQHGHWEWEDLVQTLHDTLELAKIRAVEPAHVRDDLYGQLLPLLIGDMAPYSELTGEVGESFTEHRVILDFGAVQPPAP